MDWRQGLAEGRGEVESAVGSVSLAFKAYCSAPALRSEERVVRARVAAKGGAEVADGAVAADVVRKLVDKSFNMRSTLRLLEDSVND